MIKATKALEKVQGVQKVVVSLEAETAKVAYDSHQANRAQLETAIKETGFTAK